MRRVLFIAAAVALVMVLGAAPVLAAKGDNPANDKEEGVGNANVAFLYLYEKDAGWNIVWDGAWGKMNFKLDGTSLAFVFNGHKLEKNTGYSLVYWPENWPNVLVLAQGSTNNGGNIHIAGTADLTGETNGSMTDWDPSAYLFEHNLIGEGYKIWLVKTADLEQPGI